MTPKTPWAGDVPNLCQWCNRPLSECTNRHDALSLGKTFYDARTIMGSWAMLGEGCFAAVGVGTGVGKGQRYLIDTGEKVEG